MNYLFDFFALLVGVAMGIFTIGLTSANARAQEREELAKLRGFAQDILNDWPDVGYIDGFDLQQLAHKHGLLVSKTTFAPCGEHCTCAEMVDEYEWAEGVTCFRKTDLLKGGAA